MDLFQHEIIYNTLVNSYSKKSYSKESLLHLFVWIAPGSIIKKVILRKNYFFSSYFGSNSKKHVACSLHRKAFRKKKQVH